MEVQERFNIELARRLGNERYDLWFGSAALSIHEGLLLVNSPDRFSSNWLQKHFRADLDATCNEVVGHSCPIEFKVDSSLKKPEAVSELKPANRNGKHGSSAPASEGEHNAGSGSREQSLFGRRRFASLKSFVKGNGNQLAVTVAHQLLQEPGAFSPVVFHGPTGCGKTHLLEGIWSHLRRNRDTRRVVYLTAEQFTTYFLEALQGGSLPGFRNKYRDTDVLLIDDIQFFTGKRATVMELQHTLDAMLRDGRQVILAADRRPGEIHGLGKELSARMEAGLLCEIHPADAETRLEIARQMATGRSISVPNDVLELVARRISGDARRLSGALNRLQAASAAYQLPISVRLAEQHLADLWGETSATIELETIEQVVCEHCGIAADSLHSKKRSRPIANSRMLAMWLARKFTRSAYKDIGSYFGGRSHSTVISAQKSVEAWLADGSQLDMGHGLFDARDIVSRLEAKLRA